jgi:competence ComEA-like helix-hairpin-helix protein
MCSRVVLTIRRLAACPAIALAITLTACAGEPEPIILETPNTTATVHIEPEPTKQATRTPAPTSEAHATPLSPVQSPKVNINTADEATLDTLPRIGPALAGRIVAYRLQHGPFKSIENLKDVRGIGDATFEAVKDLIVVE